MLSRCGRQKGIPSPVAPDPLSRVLWTLDLSAQPQSPIFLPVSLGPWLRVKVIPRAEVGEKVGGGLTPAPGKLPLLALPQTTGIRDRPSSRQLGRRSVTASRVQLTVCAKKAPHCIPWEGKSGQGKTYLGTRLCRSTKHFFGKETVVLHGRVRVFSGT